MGKCALSPRDGGEWEGGRGERGREVLPLDLSSSYITFTCSALPCGKVKTPLIAERGAEALKCWRNFFGDPSTSNSGGAHPMERPQIPYGEANFDSYMIGKPGFQKYWVT